MKVKAVQNDCPERRKSLKGSAQKWRKSAKKPRGNKVTLYKLLKTSLRYQGSVFFRESTLHGVRYIAETDRPFIERFIWFICVLIGAISTMVIIVSLWEKFQTNPTITGLDTDFHNWDIPFPAVTLCPNQPGNVERLQAYIEKKAQEQNLNETMVEKLTDFLERLTQISLSSLENGSIAFSPEMATVLGEENLHDLAYNLMDRCEDLLRACKWLAEDTKCCDRFFPIFTENGFCFTFNSPHHEDNYPDGKEIPDISTEYIKETDLKWSVQFYLEPHVNSSYNISIYLHKSNELPGLNLKPQHVWDFKMLGMSFSMRETYTTPDARQLSIKQRHCIYDNEVHLKIDSLYTYAACTHQCRMQNAERLCHCVPHFYKEQKNHAFCNITQLECIAENKDSIVNVENCACELGCSNTIYEVDKLTEKTSAVVLDDSFTSEEDQNQVIEVFECEFTSWPMIKYKREVLFGWVDLLVSFGGIAGLFLGFSLLSGVEIIYYFTIRALCMVHKQRDELVVMVTKPPPKEKQDYDLGLAPSFIHQTKEMSGRDIIRARMKKELSQLSQIKPEPVAPRPILVKTLNPNNKIIMPPFGFDYYN